MRRIRLTESQLHRVIKESVHRILEDDGMDWKDYRNASFKRYQQEKPSFDDEFGKTDRI
jgi:hypothetical protein